MNAFRTHTGRVLPMDRANVDTDAIIPKQYLKSIRRTGFGPFLFDDWRYLDAGDLQIDVASRRVNPDFELNDPRYAGASILLARRNFGCGSSREHAVWALENAGFRCVIAPSFADIFFNNCFKNGVLPIVLEEKDIDMLFAFADGGAELTIDLEQQQIAAGDRVLAFDTDTSRRERLLAGLDDIGQTLQFRADIEAFEARRRAEKPWLFGAPA
ncbi:MAG: 3-isopropylmalate dehydratase small subunit [Oceanococcaceae bacterium]